jgi:hypothetical protein
MTESSSRYFLQGGINNGQDVYLYFMDTSTKPNTPYLLVKQSNNLNPGYMVSSTTVDNTGTLGTTFIPTFTVEVIEYSTKISEPVVYKLKDTISSYVAIDNNGFITNTKWTDSSDISSSQCKSIQTDYQPWRSPVAFLAGGNYNFNIGDNTTFSLNEKGDTVNISNLILYIVPVNWYQQGFCVKAAITTLGLTYTYCYITDNKDNVCSDIPYAWTTNSDCNLSLPYSYCRAGTGCSAQCKGPCTKSGQQCNWNIKQETFECDTSIGNVFSGPWWKSTWAIVILSTIAGIAIIFVILLPFLHMKKDEFSDNGMSGNIIYDQDEGYMKITKIG